MLKATSFVGLAIALALMSSAALAEQGNVIFLGQRRLGACDPHPVADAERSSMELRQSAAYQAQDSADWLRQHGKGLFPFFQ